MASYNKVILMGNLTRKPELRYTQNGMAICKFGLAVNRRFKDSASGEWREEPTFVDITIFGKRGEAFEKYHDKGRPAFVEGELRFDTWEDRESGQKRSKLYVVAENWEFVGGGGREGTPQILDAPAGAGSGGYGGYGDSEASSGGSSAGSGAGPSAGSGGGGDFLDVDDAPF